MNAKELAAQLGGEYPYEPSKELAAAANSLSSLAVSAQTRTTLGAAQRKPLPWIQGKLQTTKTSGAMTDMPNQIQIDFRKILSRDGKSTGTTTGSRQTCRLSGCTGIRITVRWKDGKHTYPCTKGLVATKKPGVWRIG
jgi:hypothetical protein